MAGITWLHISDLHFRESQAFDSAVVSRALLSDLSRLGEFAPKLDKIDLIFVTGDVAFSGNPREYALAHKFLDELRRVVHVNKSRLFVIPGNHDVDRDLISDESRSMVSQLNTRQAINKLMDTLVNRNTVLDRLKNYGKFINGYFGRQLQFDNDQYFYVKKRIISGKRVAISGLNTAWASSSDADRLNLFLGENQVRSVIELAKNADIHIGLIHHPFDWLQDIDRNTNEALLLHNCHFILRGHLHETSLMHQQAPGTDSILIAAGACYESRDYPNSYNLVHVNLDTLTANIYLRRYSDKDGGFWTLDSTTYRDVQGKYTFPVAFLDKTNRNQELASKKNIDYELPIGAANPSLSAELVNVPTRFVRENALNEWWKKRGYLSDPFIFDNAEDVKGEKILEVFQWWYVDPEMPANNRGLGVPHFLNKVKSITTNDPVLLYIPKGGGKTFYRKWASAQIEAYESNCLSVEIADLVDGTIDPEQIKTIDIAKHVYKKICEKLKLTGSKELTNYSRTIFSQLNDDLKKYIVSHNEVKSIFVFLDGVDQLFDEHNADQNYHSFQALAEMCKVFADLNDKVFALRLFMPLELEKQFREALGNKYALQVRHYPIYWDLNHCESILEARLDTYWENGPNSLLGGHLERLLSQDAITELRRGLQGVHVSPRCVIRLFKELGDYAYIHGVSVDQLINSKIMIDFMKNNANLLCSVINYPLKLIL